MLSSPILAYRRALKTAYVITDRRAIVVAGGGMTTIRSYPPEKLGDVFRRERSDGTGDVVFSTEVVQGARGRNTQEDLGFLGVAEPKKVEEMLKELAKKSAVAAY